MYSNIKSIRWLKKSNLEWHILSTWDTNLDAPYFVSQQSVVLSVQRQLEVDILLFWPFETVLYKAAEQLCVQYTFTRFLGTVVPFCCHIADTDVFLLLYTIFPLAISMDSYVFGH